MPLARHPSSASPRSLVCILRRPLEIIYPALLDGFDRMGELLVRRDLSLDEPSSTEVGYGAHELGRDFECVKRRFWLESLDVALGGFTPIHFPSLGCDGDNRMLFVISPG